MKKPISEEKLLAAFLKGKLGTEDDYLNWTPLWALRGRVWQTKKLKKGAHDWFGELGVEAVEEADPAAIRDLAAALQRMLQAERTPEYALRADVFFAVEELNDLGRQFSRRKLLSWLNDEMDALMTKEDVAGALEEMGLAGVVR